MIDSFIKKVVLYDDRIEIDYYYGEKKVSSILTETDDSTSLDDTKCSFKLPLGLPSNSPTLSTGQSWAVIDI